MARKMVKPGADPPPERPEPKAAKALELPADVGNEQVILAAACVDAAARSGLVRRYRPDHFHVERHRPAWAAIQEVERRGLQFDFETLRRVGGPGFDPSYVAELVRLRPDAPPNLGFHERALMWDHSRALAVEGPLAALVEKLRDPREDPGRIRALARALADQLSSDADSYLLDPQELVRRNMADLGQRIDGLRRYPFGIPWLDDFEARDGEEPRRRLVVGAQPGYTTVVTAMSGSGKSTLTARIALGLARPSEDEGRRVLYGAWEQNSNVTLELLACMLLGWSRTFVIEGRREWFTPERRREFEEAQHLVSQRIRFMANPFRRRRGDGGTRKDARNERNLDLIQQHIADSGCEVFIADLWKRCLRDTSPDEEEDALMRQQAIHEEEKVHGILVQQQRLKDIEQRADKRPTREGIKGSGAWVEIADNIIGAHRPALWKRVPDDALEVIILKQRYGRWPLAIRAEWDGDRGSIENGVSVEYEQPGEQEIGSAFVAPRRSGPRKQRRGRYVADE